ncbi:uncharacterized protein LOC105436747 [Strongylocentrotus purpuratus]|uniref:Uncharacterized protein n=1 Tax=Strongylocentrotus purpuratus TaxID=7668 RepID=A0A7M7HEY3_STRPU|nr:uncharacterized protein LOC105436747 [Strongylocentrotus purpuratus]|eukprot:XP_011660947.1 PREDICTED: uncharacterized protein LOC105436747 [Strongylocentrotus purpuratus]
MTCTCTNGTISCVVERCKGNSCVEPVRPPGDCCYICPYDVTVRKVKPTIQSKRNVTTNGDTTLVLAVDVTFRYTRSSTGVIGESLWQLSAWIAPVTPTHSHTVGYTEQVLNVDQASQSYIEGDQFIFRDVVYPFVAPTFNCDEAKVCVELKRGRNAVTTRPFRFSSYPQSSTPLVGCISLCTGRK